MKDLSRKSSEPPALNRLATLLNAAVASRKGTHTALAEAINLDRGELSRILNEQQAPPWRTLATLANELRVDVVEAAMLRVLHELRAPDDDDELAAHDRDASARACVALKTALDAHRGARPRLPRRPDLLTLEDWPHHFSVSAVIVGDRREIPYHKMADALAFPASAGGDLTYYGSLNLRNVRIRSDKIIYEAPMDSLRKQLAGDILVIGSPGANLAARVVNDLAFFRFHIPYETRAKLHDFEHDLRKLKGIPSRINSYFDSPEKRSKLSHMLQEFAQSGFIDPVDHQGLRGTKQPRHIDFGIVTLCRNPWDEHGTAVLAAGIHGPGTAAALEYLSHPANFREHPLGGVFQVEFDPDAPWEQRYDEFKITWDSHLCEDCEAFLAAASTLSGNLQRDGAAPDKGLNDQDLQQLGALIELLKRRAPGKSSRPPHQDPLPHS